MNILIHKNEEMFIRRYIRHGGINIGSLPGKIRYSAVNSGRENVGFDDRVRITAYIRFNVSSSSSPRKNASSFSDKHSVNHLGGNKLWGGRIR